MVAIRRSSSTSYRTFPWAALAAVIVRRIGLGETLRIALLGNDERVGATTALRIGPVSEVVSAEQLWARAHEIAAAEPQGFRPATDAPTPPSYGSDTAACAATNFSASSSDCAAGAEPHMCRPLGSCRK